MIRWSIDRPPPPRTLEISTPRAYAQQRDRLGQTGHHNITLHAISDINSDIAPCLLGAGLLSASSVLVGVVWSQGKLLLGSAEARLARTHNCLRTTADAELAKDDRHVIADRPFADPELCSNRVVVEPLRH